MIGLVIVGLVGATFIVLSIKKDDKKEENRSFKEVINKEKEIDSRALEEIYEIRNTIGESLTELQLEINFLKEEIKNLKESKTTYKEHIKEPVINNINFQNMTKKDDKAEKIKVLLKEGLTDDEISFKLKVNKGEVQLVRGLFN